MPLREMFGYVGDLRSKTSGQASYSMEFDSYGETPKSVAEEIIAKGRGGLSLTRPGRAKNLDRSVHEHLAGPNPADITTKTAPREPAWRTIQKEPQWQRPSSSGPSRTATSAPSGTSTTARPR